MLQEDHRLQTTQALLALQIQTLAAFAVWDKKAGQQLERFRRSLAEMLTPPPVADSDQVAAVLTGWGAAIEDPR